MGSLLSAVIRAGVPEELDQGNCGQLYPPENPESMAAAIINYLRDPDFMKRMGKAAKRRAEQFFNEKTQLQSMLRHYDTLLDSH